MGQFDRAIATAKRLIEKNGQAVTWRQFTNETDADEPWKTDSTPTDKSVVIVFFPDNRTGYEFARSMGNSEVPRGNTIGLMAAQDFTPTLKDQIVRDGKVYSIESLEQLRPNDQLIMWTVGLNV